MELNILQVRQAWLYLQPSMRLPLIWKLLLLYTLRSILLQPGLAA